MTGPVGRATTSPPPPPPAVDPGSPPASATTSPTTPTTSATVSEPPPLRPGGLRYDLARPFQLTLDSPFTNPVANSEAQMAIVALGTTGMNGLAAAVPYINDHWWLRVPEWGLTYLGLTELRIYGHEHGHARVAELYGANATIDMHLHWGVTHTEGHLTPRQDVEVTAAGMNQGERDATRQWSRLSSQRSWTYQEQLSYFLHHFNQTFYVIGSAASQATGHGQSGDDVNNYASGQLSGRPMDQWSVGVPSLLAAAASPAMWQAVYGQIRFLGWGERDAAPWRLSAGPVSFGMPHFEVLLGAHGRTIGGYTQMNVGDRVGIETQTHVGIDSGAFRQGARVDVRALPQLTVSPYLAITVPGRTPLGGTADDEARVGGAGGVQLIAVPLASVGSLPRELRGATIGLDLAYSRDDAIRQGVEHAPSGFRPSLSIGMQLP